MKKKTELKIIHHDILKNGNEFYFSKIKLNHIKPHLMWFKIIFKKSALWWI